MVTPRFSSGTAPVLVGREREQLALHDRLAAALAGHGSLVLVGGEAGIGKTTLAESVCNAAQAQGALVLIGRCYDLTETPPYGPWIELFGRYQRADGPPLPTAFAERGTVGEVTSQAMLFQQMQDFFTLLTMQRPLILLLDDLHWADPASLDLLRFLARSLAALPLLIVVTYRSDELTSRHALYQSLPTLVRESHAERLDLRPLAENDVWELIEARYRLGPADAARLIAYLHNRAEGNPFFLGELLRTLQEEETLRATDDSWTLDDLQQVRIPPLLRQVIDGRLARLGEEAQRLLGAAAVIGQEVSLALWEVVADVEEEAVLAVVERATEARVMAETLDGRCARFVHALVRETLYEEMTPTRRRALHRQVGEVLAASSTPDPDAVASHFQRAADARAVEWLLCAAKRAEQSWAWLTAADRYESALGLIDKEDVKQRARLLYIIAVLRRGTHQQDGIALLDMAISLSAQTGDQVLAACATWQRGLLYCSIKDFRQGVRDVEAADTALDALTSGDHARVREFDLIGSDLDKRDRVGAKAVLLALVGRYEDARTLSEHPAVFGSPRGEGDRREVNPAVRALGIAYAGLGVPDAAHEAFLRMRAIHRATKDHFTVIQSITDELERVLLPYHADQIYSWHTLLAEADEASRQNTDSIYDHGYDTSRLAHLLFQALKGAWAPARQFALKVRGTQDLAARRHIATRVLGFIACHQGETELAWALVREELPDGPATLPGDIRFLDAQIAQELAITLATDAGDLPTARAWLEAHERWLAWSGSVPGRSEGQTLWARFYRASGEPERAYGCARDALVFATLPRQPLALIAAHRLIGALDTDAGCFADAEKHLNESLAIANACQAPYERARTLLAIAELRAASDQWAGAAALLDTVRALCEPLGAKPALARANILAARRDPPRSTAPIYPADLSAREVEVLRLVAAGHTSRQIADALSLSPRTIDVHLRNIFAKTGTENRAGATAFAFRHGLA